MSEHTLEQVSVRASKTVKRSVACQTEKEKLIIARDSNPWTLIQRTKGKAAEPLWNVVNRISSVRSPGALAKERGKSSFPQ